MRSLDTIKNIEKYIYPLFFFRWGAGSWSACNKSCGSNSTQFRTVLCKESNKFLNGTEYENEVDELKCGNLIKPESFRRCFVSPCFFKWKTEPWGQVIFDTDFI